MARPRGTEADPRALLPDRLSLAEFLEAVRDAETVLEVQRETRLPRSRVKRLLSLLDVGQDLRSPAEGVAALRRER